LQAFFASPVNVARAGGRVVMRQHGKGKRMPCSRKGIVQAQPTTINALPRMVCRAWRCAVPATAREPLSNLERISFSKDR